MHMTLEKLPPSHEATVICTDSQPLLMTIQFGIADTSGLRRMLDKRTYSGPQAKRDY